MNQANAARKKIQAYSYGFSDLLGQGYSSKVYKGTHDLLGREVAVKVIDVRKVQDAVHKALLNSEIQALQELKAAKRILHLNDIYRSANNIYIVTELCEGGDLAKALETKGKYSDKEAWGLLCQLLEGYEELYHANIVHRDLKPANIFIKDGQIKIADLGFAMKITDAEKYKHYNVGSPIYMPPETLKENIYSYKSDIWALGVIYFELLTGRTPWRAKNEKELEKNIKETHISSLIPQSISTNSRNFLLRCLCVDPNERASPEEIIRFKDLTESAMQETLSIQNINVKLPTLKRTSTMQSIKGNDENIHPSILGAEQSTLSYQRSMQSVKSNTQRNRLQSTAQATTDSLQSAHGLSINLHDYKSVSNRDESTRDTSDRLSLQKKNSLNEVGAKYDCKLITKQLLSQVHLCRYFYKLLVRMRDTGLVSRNDTILSYMSDKLFEKLYSVNNLTVLSKSQIKEYKDTKEATKVGGIVYQYLGKYEKDLVGLTRIYCDYNDFKIKLTNLAQTLYLRVCAATDLATIKDEVIVLDYLITLRQLLSLDYNLGIVEFNSKSKIETIVEGVPTKVITPEHVKAITEKMKTLKMITE